MTDAEPRGMTPFAEVQPRPAAVGRFTAAFGRVSVTAQWLADRLDRTELGRPTAVLIAGDHLGPDDGSNLPGPAGMLLTRLAGPAGVRVVEVDVATTHATDTEFVVRRGHPDPALDDAATRDQVLDAVEVGKLIADREIDSGADLLIPGLAGRGHAVPLATLAVALCGLEPIDTVFVDDPAQWATTVASVRDASFRIKERDGDALTLLAAVGGADLAALAALIAQAAARRTPVLLDGSAATTAALLAHRLAPGAENWFLAAGEAPDRAGRRLQEMLGLPAVAALGTSAWSGAGSLLMLPALRAALAG